MRHTLLISVLVALCICSVLNLQMHRPYHQYWFNKWHPNYTGNDNRWNYCDHKCLTLEKFANDKDFVVVVLSALFK